MTPREPELSAAPARAWRLQRERLAAARRTPAPSTFLTITPNRARPNDGHRADVEADLRFVRGLEAAAASSDAAPSAWTCDTAPPFTSLNVDADDQMRAERLAEVAPN